MVRRREADRCGLLNREVEGLHLHQAGREVARLVDGVRLGDLDLVEQVGGVEVERHHLLVELGGRDLRSVQRGVRVAVAEAAHEDVLVVLQRDADHPLDHLGGVRAAVLRHLLLADRIGDLGRVARSVSSAASVDDAASAVTVTSPTKAALEPNLAGGLVDYPDARLRRRTGHDRLACSRGLTTAGRYVRGGVGGRQQHHREVGGGRVGHHHVGDALAFEPVTGDQHRVGAVRNLTDEASPDLGLDDHVGALDLEGRADHRLAGEAVDHDAGDGARLGDDRRRQTDHNQGQRPQPLLFHAVLSSSVR